MPLNRVCKYELLPTTYVLQTAKARDEGLEANQVTNFPPVREAITNLPH